MKERRNERKEAGWEEGRNLTTDVLRGDRSERKKSRKRSRNKERNPERRKERKNKEGMREGSLRETE